MQRRHGAASSLDHHSISARAVLFAEGAHGVLGEVRAQSLNMAYMYCSRLLCLATLCAVWLPDACSRPAASVRACLRSVQDVIAKRGLRAEAGADPQAYALGFREIWQVPDDVHKEGTVEHVVGYPLGSRAYGGGYLYHLADKRVAIGLVVGLDYKNPYLAPHEEFARWKQHPFVSRVIGGGTRVEHGARITATGAVPSLCRHCSVHGFDTRTSFYACVFGDRPVPASGAHRAHLFRSNPSPTAGGFQSVPECAFAGGALIGCVAGVVNMAQLRGTHMAMKTGILAADAAYHEIAGGDEGATSPLHMRAYHRSLRDSWVMRELEQARPLPGAAFACGSMHACIGLGTMYSAEDASRTAMTVPCVQAQNVRPGFRWGLWAGLLNAAIQTGVFPLLLGGSPWRMQHRYSDREVTHTAAQCKPIAYSRCAC